MNYGELKQAIMDYSHRPDLAAQVPGFVRLAESLIARELTAVEQTTTATLAEVDRVSAGIYTLPPRALQVRVIYYQNGARTVTLEQVSLATIRCRTSSGAVAQYAVRGSQIEVRGVPPADAELTVEYVTRLAPLTGDTDTNDLLTNHEGIYLYGSLAHLYGFTQDLELAGVAMDLAMADIEKLNQQAGRKLSGASIAGAYNLYGGGGAY